MTIHHLKLDATLVTFAIEGSAAVIGLCFKPGGPVLTEKTGRTGARKIYRKFLEAGYRPVGK